jgi:hemolysin activation/secretion protein
MVKLLLNKFKTIRDSMERQKYLIPFRNFFWPGFLIPCLFIFLQFSQPAMAQIPSAGDAGIVEKSLRESRPLYLPPPPEKIPDITIQDDRKLKDAGAGPSFFVKKIEVEGNTLISDEELAPIVDLKQGMDVSLGILSLYAEEITAYYTLKGYLLIRAFIPAQKIKNGIVKLQVVEGVVGNISVQSSKDYQQKDHQQNILDRLWRVEKGNHLLESDLVRSLLELNDILGLSVKSTLKRGKEFGESDLIVKAENERPFLVSFDADNFGSRFTGRNRFGVTGTLGNIFTLADRFSLRSVNSSMSQSSIEASYLIPVNHYGTTLNLSFTRGEFELGGILKSLDAGGDSRVFGMQLFHPILRTKTYRLDASAGLEIRDYENRQLGIITSNDDLNDLVFSVSGDLEDAYRGRTFLGMTFRQGMTQGNSNRLLNSRFRGRGDASIFNWKFRRFQSAYVLNSYFILNATAQAAGARVMSPNLMFVGGMGTVYVVKRICTKS